MKTLIHEIYVRQKRSLLKRDTEILLFRMLYVLTQLQLTFILELKISNYFIWGL
jgi:hypothetical protein